MNKPDLGLPEFDPKLGFFEIFETVFAPLLAHRAEGFRTVFKYLKRPQSHIVETGCLRAPGNWSGDGQSTYLFDRFIEKNGGICHSIDINPESIAQAVSFCPNTTFIVGDAATTILSLEDYNIDLLYLDSFDAFRDVSVIPAPIHYLLELCAAWPMLISGSLVAIDDIHCRETRDLPASKGLGVELFLEKIGAEVLHDDYMKVWRLR